MGRCMAALGARRAAAAGRPGAYRPRLGRGPGARVRAEMMKAAARSAQRGVAVVLAMAVVALAAIAAASMLASQSTWARHAELTAEHVQAQALVQAGVDWARALLSDDRRLSNVDHLGEPWAMRLPAVPVHNGQLAGDIDDQHGRLKLKNPGRNGAVSPSPPAQ